ncbi:helix-turn-helix domain-containing protein [Geodermatophilus marinus]|uniref:helix-turn-helix domain-containing protein n=1 Tax=Geodermatophilus sp. LHW52908 TaxID=2303986 RepID=UPI0013140EF2|nr:helix-turn-helix domain-containing protein [Geodermatophilus sp. LHW52908]
MTTGAPGVYTVGDLAEAAGVSAQTIREWERRGHLVAGRTAGGQRRFDETARSEARRLAAARRRSGHTAAAAPLPDDAVELARTGARIRAARLKAGLSQNEAAARIGVSRSFLSTVERGQSGVSVHVLATMADVFGIPMGEFSPQPAPTAVLHPDERPRTVLAGGVTWEELVTPGRAVEPALLHVPGGQSSGGRVTRPGETFVFVLDGSLRLEVEGTAEPITLTAGDALLVEAATAYAWSNPGRSAARCLWVEEVPRARGRTAGR